MMSIGLMMSGVAALLAAQAPPNTPEPGTIVVTGTRDAKKDIQDFVRALTPVRIGGGLSRFEQSVCPVVVGLPARQGGAVANRMRRIAKAVDIDVGGADCVPNVVVMVTKDKNVLVEELRRRHPHYFGEMSRSQIRKRARQPGSAVAWQTEGRPVSARGVELFYDPAIDAYVNQTTDAASRIETGGRRQFDGAVVVVERAALAGLTVTQLADYAALRAFTGADPTKLKSNAVPTILRILDAPAGSEVPASLTERDLAFLRGYYSSPLNHHTGAQRSAISRTIEQEAERRVVK